jgi:uncharacterized protein involved in exopolysaccharide biosynthesis
MWMTAVITGAAVVYALTATVWYRADVLLVAAEQQSSQGLQGLGNLTTLAGLAGIRSRGGATVEPIAVLRSRDFIGEFIEARGIRSELVEAQPWWARSDSSDEDPREAIQFFIDNVLSVSEDVQTGLVSVSIQWLDPVVAADWANSLVRRVNDRMRERALKQADSHVTYLKQELATANLVTLQQSIGSLLESELQKAMLARVNEEFAFKVIDPAEVPKWRARPSRRQVVAFAVVVGLLVSSLTVLVRQAIRRHRAAESDRQGGQPATS